MGGCVINLVQFADEKAILAHSAIDLQLVMDNVSIVTEYGMKINTTAFGDLKK